LSNFHGWGSDFRAEYASDVPAAVLLRKQDSVAGACFGSRFCLLQEISPVDLAGISTSLFYFGTPGSSFGWHIEDCNLCSISYLHAGLEKRWWVLPPYQANLFEKTIASKFGGTALQDKTLAITARISCA